MTATTATTAGTTDGTCTGCGATRRACLDRLAGPEVTSCCATCHGTPKAAAHSGATTPRPGASARTLSAIESTFRDAGYGASVVQPMGCTFLVARIVTNDADTSHDAPAMCELLHTMTPLIRENGFTFTVYPAPCAQRYHVRLQAV